jgi:UPF0042 nucleotide-binding protein
MIMRIIIVTGISGSGKSVALNVLEDSGYFCIDNLPCELLMVATRNAFERGITRFAVAIDVRSLGVNPINTSLKHNNPVFIQAIEALTAWQSDVRVVFLTANTPTLIARYSETRRNHPLSRLNSTLINHSLAECIELERESLLTVQQDTHIIDTSGLSNAALRHSIKQFSQAGGVGITLTFESFGFKYAVPQDADLVFDARCLPNPHYEPDLKALTGLDQPVINYFKHKKTVEQFIEDIIMFLNTWLPRYEYDGRHYLTVAIGCTGGQHRSVYVAEQLALYFHTKARVITRHRQQAAYLA